MHFLSWSCFFKLGGVGTWIEYSFLDETHMCHLNEGNYVRDGHINNDKSSFWKKKKQYFNDPGGENTNIITNIPAIVYPKNNSIKLGKFVG
jgi:hypothetical protein